MTVYVLVWDSDFGGEWVYGATFSTEEKALEYATTHGASLPDRGDRWDVHTEEVDPPHDRD